MLDILFEQIPYNRIIELPITNIFLATEGEDRTVRVPDANYLLADKLTAFAPRTIGVPYRKGNSECGMEIMKQLYDIGALFDKADDMVSLSAVYRRLPNRKQNIVTSTFPLKIFFTTQWIMLSPSASEKAKTM